MDSRNNSNNIAIISQIFILLLPLKIRLLNG